MKKALLAIALCATFSGFAQVLTVESEHQLATPENSMAKVVAISPTGDYILLSNDNNASLTRFDLATGEAKKLTDAPGAGYNVQISQDGNEIVYRETQFNEQHLRYSSLQSMNMLTGAREELIAPTRDLQGYAVENHTAAAIDGGKMKAKSLNGSQARVERPVLSIKNRQLMITRNGTTEVFSPNGQEYSYIWESVSPNGKNVLYYVCGVGAFVCDVHGQNKVSLGILRAPQWYDDNTIVGMYDIDNGDYTTSSVIKVATLDGKVQTITDGSRIAMYPVASPGKIVYSTPYGEAYLINVKK